MMILALFSNLLQAVALANFVRSILSYCQLCALKLEKRVYPHNSCSWNDHLFDFAAFSYVG